MSTIAKRIREERERIGMSQEDVASHAGVSKRSQVAYETGENIPDLDYLAKLIKRGFDADYVLTGLRRLEIEMDQYDNEAGDSASADLEEIVATRRKPTSPALKLELGLLLYAKYSLERNTNRPILKRFLQSYGVK